MDVVLPMDVGAATLQDALVALPSKFQPDTNQLPLGSSSHTPTRVMEARGPNSLIRRSMLSTLARTTASRPARCRWPTWRSPRQCCAGCSPHRVGLHGSAVAGAGRNGIPRPRAWRTTGQRCPLALLPATESPLVRRAAVARSGTSTGHNAWPGTATVVRPRSARRRDVAAASAGNTLPGDG